MPSARQHVGRARLGGEGAVAVLGDRHAGAGHDEGRAGRDVVGAVVVAAGADDVDGAVRRAHPLTLARSARAPPASSSAVSPRTFRPIRKAPIWAGVASPEVMMSKARSASSMASVSPLPTLARRPRKSSMSPLTTNPVILPLAGRAAGRLAISHGSRTHPQGHRHGLRRLRQGRHPCRHGCGHRADLRRSQERRDAPARRGGCAAITKAIQRAGFGVAT